MANCNDVQQQQTQCPPGCCNGTEILCISIPCPITIVLLGLNLTLNLPCVRLTSTAPLTQAQIAQILQVLINIISTISATIPGTPLTTGKA